MDSNHYQQVKLRKDLFPRGKYYPFIKFSLFTYSTLHVIDKDAVTVLLFFNPTVVLLDSNKNLYWVIAVFAVPSISNRQHATLSHPLIVANPVKYTSVVVFAEIDILVFFSVLYLKIDLVLLALSLLRIIIHLRVSIGIGSTHGEFSKFAQYIKDFYNISIVYFKKLFINIFKGGYQL